MRQILERADSRQHVGSALNDASGSNRLNPSSTDVADGSNSSLRNVPSGPTGMQGAFVTVDDNGAVRVVPVRSRGAVHLPLGHVHVPAGHVHVDPLFSRFQRQFNFRTTYNPSSDPPVPSAANPLPSASSGSFRQMDQAGLILPGIIVHAFGALWFQLRSFSFAAYCDLFCWYILPERNQFTWLISVLLVPSRSIRGSLPRRHSED